MATLFVDVDDTLIIYKDLSRAQHPYGTVRGEEYKPNFKLIERIRKFKGYVVIWSGGGKDYARTIARKVLIPENIRCQIGSKFDDFNLIEPGDIVIDDQKEYFKSMEVLGVKVYGPFENWTLE